LTGDREQSFTGELIQVLPEKVLDLSFVQIRAASEQAEGPQLFPVDFEQRHRNLFLKH
jgi:hypothetical protein